MNAHVLLSAVIVAPLVAAPHRPWVQVPTISLIQHRADYVTSLERFFRVIDTKAGGYFIARDLTLPGYHIAYPPVPYPQAQLQAPFRCVDANRDRKITREEYVEYGARAFDATIRDGYLDHVAFAHAVAPTAGCK